MNYARVVETPGGVHRTLFEGGKAPCRECPLWHSKRGRRLCVYPLHAAARRHVPYSGSAATLVISHSALHAEAVDVYPGRVSQLVSRSVCVGRMFCMLAQDR